MSFQYVAYFLTWLDRTGWDGILPHYTYAFLIDNQNYHPSYWNDENVYKGEKLLMPSVQIRSCTKSSSVHRELSMVLN